MELLTIAEAAPQFRKTEASMRFFLNKSDCPIRMIRLGKKIYIPQESIDQFFADAMKEVA